MRSALATIAAGSPGRRGDSFTGKSTPETRFIIVRYGNVRQTDTEMVAGVVDGLVARICIGLPVAVASLDDEAAAEMFKLITATHSAITMGPMLGRVIAAEIGGAEPHDLLAPFRPSRFP